MTETDHFVAFCRRGLLSNYLDQHSLPASPVEFAVENLFPRPEFEFAFGDCDDDFTAHDLTFQVGIGVVADFVDTTAGLRGNRVSATTEANVREIECCGYTATAILR